jgi:excisionase family DNA binding protein
MDTMHLPLLVAMPDVPKYLGDISRSKIYELVANGELTRIRIGRRAFISGESIAGFLDKLLTSGDAA